MNWLMRLSVPICLTIGISIGDISGIGGVGAGNVAMAALQQESKSERKNFQAAAKYMRKNHPRSYARTASQIPDTSPFRPIINYWEGVFALRRNNPEMLYSLYIHSPSAYVQQESGKLLAMHYLRKKQWDEFEKVADADPCSVLIYRLRERERYPDAIQQLRLTWYDDWKLNMPLCIRAYRLARQMGVLTTDDIWRKLRQVAGERLLRPTHRVLRHFKLPIRYTDVRAVVKRPVTYIRGKHPLKTRAQQELVMIAAIAAARFNMDTALQRWRAFSVYYSAEQQEQVWAKLAERAARAHRNDALEIYRQAPSPDVHDANSRAWHVRAAIRVKDYDTVVKVVESMPPIQSSLTAWRYWHAVALGKTDNGDGKNQQRANTLLRQLANDSDDFYGLLAREETAMPLVPLQPLELEISASDASTTSKSDNNANNAESQDGDYVDYSLALAARRAGHTKLARKIWKVANQHSTPHAALLAADAAIAINWHLGAINAANSQPHDINIHSRRFPMPYRDVIDKYSQKFNLDRAFVYALIRRESRFMPKARSVARARGLMQVLPSTARLVARQNRYTKYHLSRLTRVDTNVIIGATYLRDLAKRFNNHPVQVAAAYNAGPKRAALWHRNNRNKDILAHIENIPIIETRLYVKALLAARAHYGTRLGNPPTSMREVIAQSVRPAVLLSQTALSTL